MKTLKLSVVFAVLVAVSLFLVGCLSEVPQPVETLTETSTPTVTPTPTSTEVPTKTSTPTVTPTPTSTEVPTKTSTPKPKVNERNLVRGRLRSDRPEQYLMMWPLEVEKMAKKAKGFTPEEDMEEVWFVVTGRQQTVEILPNLYSFNDFNTPLATFSTKENIFAIKYTLMKEENLIVKTYITGGGFHTVIKNDLETIRGLAEEDKEGKGVIFIYTMEDLTTGNLQTE